MSSGNTYQGNLFLSPAVTQVIAALTAVPKPDQRPHFPRKAGWTGENSRVKVPVGSGLNVNAALRAWFKEMIGESNVADERIRDCAIEDNIACLGALSWKEVNGAKLLQFCRMQVLVTESRDGESFYGLEDFYLDESGDKGIAYYYRLELDMNMPGPLFKEPLPHVHCLPDGPPRFAFNPSSEEFLPISFLEFIYLNHAHPKWENWARHKCKNARPDLPFENIVSHFNQGVIAQKLSLFREHIGSLKSILKAAKLEAARGAPGLSPDVATLNYWC